MIASVVYLSSGARPDAPAGEARRITLDGLWVRVSDGLMNSDTSLLNRRRQTARAPFRTRGSAAGPHLPKRGRADSQQACCPKR